MGVGVISDCASTVACTLAEMVASMSASDVPPQAARAADTNAHPKVLKAICLIFVSMKLPGPVVEVSVLLN